MDTLSPRMDSWWTADDMSKYGCCAAAGMLPLPHGSHLHLSRVSACMAGLVCTDYELHVGALRAFAQGISAMAASATG